MPVSEIPEEEGGGSGPSNYPALPTVDGDYALRRSGGTYSWVSTPAFDTVAVKSFPDSAPDVGQVVIYRLFSVEQGRSFLGAVENYEGNPAPVGLSVGSLALLDDGFESYGVLIPDNQTGASQLLIETPFDYQMRLQSGSLLFNPRSGYAWAEDNNGATYPLFNFDDADEPSMLFIGGTPDIAVQFGHVNSERVSLRGDEVEVTGGLVTLGGSDETVDINQGSGTRVLSAVNSPFQVQGPIKLIPNYASDGFLVATLDDFDANPNDGVHAHATTYTVDPNGDNDPLNITRSVDDPSAFAFSAPQRTDGYVWAPLFYANSPFDNGGFLLRDADSGDVIGGMSLVTTNGSAIGLGRGANPEVQVALDPDMQRVWIGTDGIIVLDVMTDGADGQINATAGTMSFDINGSKGAAGDVLTSDGFSFDWQTP